jgi:hypothetical protein
MPEDVLTDNTVGSCIAYDDERAALWFDVGNLRTPWRAGEQILVLVEASTPSQNYYAVTAVVLKQDASVQNITPLTLEPVPHAEHTDGTAQWQACTNKDIVGYSVYQGNDRLNTALVTEGYYATDANIEVRPVARGGYEINSTGSQTGYIDQTPLSPAMTISPVPFRKNVTVSYQVSQSGWVQINIYDAAGRLVQELASGRYSAGYHTATWNAEDAAGRPVPAGVYFVTLENERYKAVEKTILLK